VVSVPITAQVQLQCLAHSSGAVSHETPPWFDLPLFFHQWGFIGHYVLGRRFWVQAHVVLDCLGKTVFFSCWGLDHMVI